MTAGGWRELREECEGELFGNILPFWTSVAVDGAEIGFHGSIDGSGTVDGTADKGLVMHARLLWTFSAARRFRDDPEYAAAAERACDFLERYLADRVHGGYWWRTDFRGAPVDRHKVVYGQAFALYAFAESLRIGEGTTGDEGAGGVKDEGDARSAEGARDRADELFVLLERYARDPESGGYREILAEDWTPVPDGRLSDADIPCDKSMNTNLHIIEAYTNYFRVRRDSVVREALEAVVDWFAAAIYDGARGHLKLFLDGNGASLAEVDSYGHDIEAAWLLHEAGEELGGSWPEKLWPVVRGLAEAAVRDGMRGADGALGYETHGGRRNDERVWWVQAEAMVGSRCLWEITGDEVWARRCLGFWTYIKENLVDAEAGEWLPGVAADGSALPGREKGGLWKTPYHNGRACMEMMMRIGAASKTGVGEIPQTDG